MFKEFPETWENKKSVSIIKSKTNHDVCLENVKTGNV